MVYTAHCIWCASLDDAGTPNLLCILGDVKGCVHALSSYISKVTSAIGGFCWYSDAIIMHVGCNTIWDD